jgi:hypothetical protein
MGSLTTYGANALLNHIFNAAYTPAAAVYLALCTADPTDAATGANMNEVPNAGAYARQAIAFGAAAARRVTQSAQVTFPQASAAWGTVTHWAVVDNATHGAGNVLAYGNLATAKQIVQNNTPSIAGGEVWIEISAGAITTPVVHKLLDLMFRNVAYAKPATHVALTTAAVTDASTGSTISEPSGNGYARKQVNVNGGAAPAWSLAAAGAVTNGAAITFATPTAGWGTVVGACVCSAASAGDVLFYDNATVVDQAVGAGDTVQFAAGDFDVSLT